MWHAGPPDSATGFSTGGFLMALTFPILPWTTSCDREHVNETKYGQFRNESTNAFTFTKINALLACHTLSINQSIIHSFIHSFASSFLLFFLLPFVLYFIPQSIHSSVYRSLDYSLTHSRSFVHLLLIYFLVIMCYRPLRLLPRKEKGAQTFS